MKREILTVIVYIMVDFCQFFVNITQCCFLQRVGKRL